MTDMANMHEHYLEAAQKVSSLAEEYSEDYALATILRTGSSRIVQLAKENHGLIIKTSSSGQMNAVQDPEEAVA